MKDRTLKLIFAVSLVIAIVFPLTSILYIYPAFTNHMVSNVENEAIRTGAHFVTMYFKDTKELTDRSIDNEFIQGTNHMMGDYGLIKVKLFAASGETIYSTDQADIGKINKKTYFHDIVAHGKPFTKMVKKDSKSLEDQIVIADVIETYVPVNKNGKFIGAFELYYDVTQRNARLNRIVMYSSFVPLILMFVFLTAIVIIIVRSTSEENTVDFSSRSLRYRSPYISMLVITLAIIAFEIIAMVFIYSIPSLTMFEETLLDGVILVMLLSPTIYFFLVQPLMKYNVELKKAEVSLKENQDLLIKDHDALNRMFNQVENAKLEWEKTVDSVEDIIIRTDKEGNITRFNKILKDISGKKYNEIIGSHLEDFISDHELEVTTLFDNSTELYCKPTGKWYMLNSYPFHDTEQQYAGNVVTLHDNTEIKKISSRLEKTNIEIKMNRDKLQIALDEVSARIMDVTTASNLVTINSGLKIRPCHEIKNCKKTECICHGKDAMRCWQIAGTYCGGKIQGQFAQKYGNCLECEVFKEATSDPISRISEQFSNMMHVLNLENRERKEAELALKESEEHFRSVFKTANDAIVSIDSRRNVIDWNEVAEKIFGYTSDEMIGKMVNKIIPGNFREAHDKAMQRFISTGEAKVMGKTVELPGLRKDGTEFSIELSIASWQSKGEIFFTAIIRDITERKLSEKALAETNQRFEDIFNNSHDGICIVNIETKKLHEGNKVMYQMLNCSPEEFTDMTFMDLHPENDLPYVIEQFEKQARREITIAENIPVKRKDGSVFYTDISASPIMLSGKEYMIGTFRDITARKEAEEELKMSQATVLQQEKMASVGQLAAGVAHEINNPMGFIASNVSSLGRYTKKITEFMNLQDEAISSAELPELSKMLNEKRKKLKLDFILEDIDQLIEESLDGADRVKKIVQNLKSFSRIDEADHKAADINECLESTLNIVWNELKYKATITKEYGEVPMTKCFPQQLNQVFLNLLVNASHAIEKQGEIIIKTWNGNGMVNISISDTGSGIPEEKLNKIFDPFFTTKPVGKGTGLGLSIAYDIVKKHNGEIAVDSEIGKGTTFTVQIPVVEE